MADKTGFNGHLMVCYVCVCYVCLYHMFNHTQVVFILSRASFEPVLSHSEPLQPTLDYKGGGWRIRQNPTIHPTDTTILTKYWKEVAIEFDPERTT